MDTTGQIQTDLALMDAAGCAAIGSVSRSWWKTEVAAGRAPQPVVRKVRMTRWSEADVRRFWAQFVADAKRDTGTSDATMARAKHASAIGKAKRLAAAEAATS